VPSAPRSLGAGLQAIEALFAEHPSTGSFVMATRLSIAGICLVSQVTPAKTYNLQLDPYPSVMRILWQPTWLLPMPIPAKQPRREFARMERAALDQRFPKILQVKGE